MDHQLTLNNLLMILVSGDLPPLSTLDKTATDGETLTVLDKTATLWKALNTATLIGARQPLPGDCAPPLAPTSIINQFPMIIQTNEYNLNIFVNFQNINLIYVYICIYWDSLKVILSHPSTLLS